MRSRGKSSYRPMLPWVVNLGLLGGACRRCTMADGRVRSGVAERALLWANGRLWSGMHLTGIGVVRDYEPGLLQLPIV